MRPNGQRSALDAVDRSLLPATPPSHSFRTRLLLFYYSGRCSSAPWLLALAALGLVLGPLAFLFMLSPLVGSSCITSFQTPSTCCWSRVMSWALTWALNSRLVNHVALQGLHWHVSNIRDQNSSWESPQTWFFSRRHLGKWQLRPYISSGSSPGVILDSSLSLPIADLSINPGASTLTVYPDQPLLTTGWSYYHHLSLIDCSSCSAGFSVSAFAPICTVVRVILLKQWFSTGGILPPRGTIWQWHF